jgi:hypothetical protein
MKAVLPWLGWFYIAAGVAGLVIWLFAEPSHLFGGVVEGNVSSMVAGGLLALIVFGILMVVGESDSRGR